MCGIGGVIDRAGVSAEFARSTADIISEALHHRGPDDMGSWIDQQRGIVLVHRRLSIVDLSSAGSQPMESADGRYVIVFNGEIYNHDELRREIDQRGWSGGWRSHSDTETLLACIQLHGFRRTLEKLVGMFAIALHDKETGLVHLARDRMGEKPLYYGENNGRLFFSSELKALTRLPCFVPEVDRDALCLFLRHNYIPAPHSIFKGISKLTPGCYTTLGSEGAEEPYWSLEESILDGRQSMLAGSDSEILTILEDRLGDAISGQMKADVPLGAFLSGGIDSSLIVSMMQERSTRKVQTFAIGFDQPEYNEAPFAKAVAKSLETDHTELYVSGKQALGVIPKLPSIYDEPFSDSSQIPTFLVSSMAREQVTVSLSGDGGDELFGGYNRYSWGNSIWRKLRPLPKPLRALLSAAGQSLAPETWNRLLVPGMRMLPSAYRQINPGDRIHKASQIFEADGPMEIYRQLISHWKDPDSVVLGGSEPNLIDSLIGSSEALNDPVSRMMFLDLHTYLPDDILAKVDRAAMAVSLETRVPFLDHRVVETAWQLPDHMKIRGGVGKWCLRQLLYRRVPQSLLDRPKTGFGVPLAHWLRTELKDWASDLLDSKRIREAGYFDPALIETAWSEHLSGTRNWHYYLWDILMFEAWRDETGL